MIDVRQEIKLYEVDGEAVTVLDHPVLVVKSHWNQNTMVVLEIGTAEEGKKVCTVLAADLEAAIENATNINRY